MAGLGDFFGGFGSSFSGSLAQAMHRRMQQQQMDMQRQKFQRELQDQARDQLLKTQGGRTMERVSGASSPYNVSGGLPSGLQPQGGMAMPQPMAPGQPSQPMQPPGSTNTSGVKPIVPQGPGMTDADLQRAKPGIAQIMQPQQPQQMQQAGLNPILAQLLKGFNQRGGQPQGMGQGGTPVAQGPAAMGQGGMMRPPAFTGGGGLPGSNIPRIGPSEPGSVPAFARGSGGGAPSFGGGGQRGFNPNLVMKYESGGRNILNMVGQSKGVTDTQAKGYTAQGFFQILNSNWQAYGPRVGIDINKYPNAKSAPYDMQLRVAQKMYDEQGYAPWAPYNDKLRAALARGEGGKSIYLAAAENPQGPEAQKVGQTPEGKQLIEQGSRGMLDWRTATRAYLAANPDAKPDEVFDGVNGMMKLMSQDSTAQWRQIQEEQRAGREQETERYHEQLKEARDERLRQGQERLDERVQEHEDRVQFLKDQLAATADKNSQKLLQDQIKREEGLQKRAEQQRDRAISQQENPGFTSLPKKTQEDVSKRAAGGTPPRVGSSAPGGTGSRGGSPAAPKPVSEQGEVPADPTPETSGKKPVTPDLQKAVEDTISSGAKTIEEAIKQLEDMGYDASWLRAKQGGIPGATTGLGL